MKLSKKQLITLYTNLVRAKAFDEVFVRWLSEGKLLGFYHSSDGAEAPGVGACSFLNEDDFLWPHIRGHGIPHMLSKGMDIKSYLAEHAGKSTGMCGGMSTFHSCDPKHGLYGWSGSIGSGFPVSVGYGLAAKKNQKKQVAICCFGDGTSNRGTLHESFLMAANWKLPVVWVCENNGLSIYVPFERFHPVENIADLAQGYGMPSAIVDGQDAIAVAEAVGDAVKRARKGDGPSLIECKCERFCGHAVGLPDLVGFEPRTDDCIMTLKEREPIHICRERLLSKGILTEKAANDISRKAAEEVAAAEKFAEESPVTEPTVFDRMLYAS
ncbi:MAG: thiamine pyrophosphate-dependent dehydrogenase E1 component subunit alpha [Deltaproteobacteria bacterium]|nr:thiamine pyrophosphate-dependent dehydrogenase E1 component subunit alpha [Deltaproteobacteria bacterium]